MDQLSLSASHVRFLLCLGLCSGVSAAVPRPGEQVDVAPFGHLCTWTGTTPSDIQRHRAERREVPGGREAWFPGRASPGDQPHLGLEWDFPQDVSRVEVEFLRAEDAVLPGEHAIEYWHDSWPPRDRGGWTRLDDPFNGRWRRPEAEFRRDATKWSYRFLPLGEKEVPQAGGVRVSHRRTYKIRVSFSDNQFPPIAALRVFSPHNWKQADLKIETVASVQAAPPGLNSASIFCGHILSPLQRIRSGDKVIAHSLRLLYSDSADDSPDRTIVTLRWGQDEREGISFLPLLALREGVFIPDSGLWIAAKDGRRFRETEFARRQGVARTIWQKVQEEPEQTYRRAREEIPALKSTAHRPFGRYVPLGCVGNRQEFGILYNGNVLCQKGALKSPGREDARMLWPGYEILYKIGTGASPDFREREGAAKQALVDGFLPIVRTEWKSGEVLFRESAVCSLLRAEGAESDGPRGDETSVLLLSLTAENISDSPRAARVWFTTSAPENLRLTGGLVYVEASDTKGGPYPKAPLRCLVETGAKPGQSAWVASSGDTSTGALAFETTLQPKANRKILFKIPFLSTLTEDEMSCLRDVEFDEEVRRTVRDWRKRISAAATIRVPNALLNDFVRAQFWHVVVTADRDVDTGLSMLPAATFHYKVCANEACHQIRSLDLRGYSQLAERYLESFVRLQGTRPLHGRFRSAEGVFHGLQVKDDVDYQTFNYNLDHGFVLWMLCEHFRLTGDTEWLERVAPNIVRGCDFIIRERRATKLTDAGGREVWQYGLLPPGHLEDNPEFLHWYAVNAYACRGMMDAAGVLSDIGSPEAGRIRKESVEFREDVRRAARRSMLLAPVVNQGNGTYMPFQPTRCLLRGRDLGWIRDSLYGPVHLIACGIYPWNSPEATWILRDAENNVFVSRERGLGIETERWWFSQGGITLQPNLVPTPIVYVHRDEPERAVRGFYNTLAASVYEDVRAFCEWLPARFGRGGGPFYKTPDESAFIVWLRYLLAVEDGDALTLCPAAPREWFADGEEITVEDLPTYFGDVTFRIISRSEKNEIRARVVPPSRSPPRELRLRIRHPQRKPIRAVQVNGRAYDRFDVSRELVLLPASGEVLDVVVQY